jgi:hypothetical protein
MDVERLQGNTSFELLEALVISGTAQPKFPCRIYKYTAEP